MRPSPIHCSSSPPVATILVGHEATAAVASETFTGTLTIIHANDLDGGTSQAFYSIEIADR